MDDNRPTPYPLRMDKELREQLERQAAKHGHSLAQEIKIILEAAVGRKNEIQALHDKLDQVLEILEKNNLSN